MDHLENKVPTFANDYKMFNSSLSNWSTNYAPEVFCLFSNRQLNDLISTIAIKFTHTAWIFFFIKDIATPISIKDTGYSFNFMHVLFFPCFYVVHISSNYRNGKLVLQFFSWILAATCVWLLLEVLQGMYKSNLSPVSAFLKLSFIQDLWLKGNSKGRCSTNLLDKVHLLYLTLNHFNLT